jgi:peptidoglycan hydrolase CwlO-like protein
MTTDITAIPPPSHRMKIIICMISEVNILLTTILTGIGTIGGLWLAGRSKGHDRDISALKDAVATYQAIIAEKDKLIDVYKKELDELLMKYDKLQAKNETLTAEIESLNKRILELEKN